MFFSLKLANSSNSFYKVYSAETDSFLPASASAMPPQTFEPLSLQRNCPFQPGYNRLQSNTFSCSTCSSSRTPTISSFIKKSKNVRMEAHLKIEYFERSRSHHIGNQEYGDSLSLMQTHNGLPTEQVLSPLIFSPSNLTNSSSFSISHSPLDFCDEIQAGALTTSWSLPSTLFLRKMQ